MAKMIKTLERWNCRGQDKSMSRVLFLCTILLLFADVNLQCFFTGQCYTKYDHGMTYRGFFNVTDSGRACIPWRRHLHDVTPEKYPNDGLDNNFCRNPRGQKYKPWCYTSPVQDGSKTWDYCKVPPCDPCLFRGMSLKEGDRFHDGCALCFCEKQGIRCLECPAQNNMSSIGCYLKSDHRENFPKCCPHRSCYGEEDFVFQEYFRYLKRVLPKTISGQ